MNEQSNQTEEKTLSKVWVVLATVLLLFVIAYFLDQIIATAIPTYSGVTSVFKAL